jgi:hypothetical protein
MLAMARLRPNAASFGGVSLRSLILSIGWREAACAKGKRLLGRPSDDPLLLTGKGGLREGFGGKPEAERV